MQKYYHPRTGKFVGRAWSSGLRCDNPDEHEPHIYKSHFDIYGPYFCDGNIKPYEPKHRKEDVNATT